MARAECPLAIVLLLQLALSVVLVALMAERSPAQFLLLGVLVCAALVFAQSAYRSWVYDFQPQGRYLFPILPMLFCYWRQSEAALYASSRSW